MFIDWNHNKRIDPVDIGISIAASGAEITDSIQLGAYIYETAEYDRVEHELIDALNPPYNSQYAEKYKNRLSFTESGIKEQRNGI